MATFTVIAVHTREGIIERREIEEHYSISMALECFGRLCSRSNGVQVIDEDGGVWATFIPEKIRRQTQRERQMFFNDQR